MKRVACITPINTPNYGTVLQAYALQEAVKQLGCDYTVLNYYSKEQELKFSFFGSTEYMDWKYRFAKKILYPIRHYQLSQILTFQNTNTQLSERYFTRESLNECESKYDVFITGSDQVWNNQEINHFDDAYFLRFAGKKTKIGYAASFGKTYSMLTNDDIEFYERNIPNIDYIGVRENSGKDIVEKTSNKDAVWVCDPVYLLTREQWERNCDNSQSGGYVMAYLVGDGINFDVNKQIVSTAREIGRKTGLKVIVVGIGLASILYGSIKTPTVSEWLGMIKNADLLLTNAFHGTAFATIFGTSFYSFVNGNADNRMNTRLFDLMSYLGLEDRIVDYKSRINPKSISRERLNYATEKIGVFRKESLDFLKESIGN